MSAFLYRLAGSPAYDPPTIATFSDVRLGHDFFAEIEWMNAFGITTGYADETYRPTSPVSRAAMSAFMHRFANPSFPLATQATFPDVPVDHTFFQEVEWMVNSGITDGYEDGTYRPSAPVSRQAMSAFMHRLHEQLPEGGWAPAKGAVGRAQHPHARLSCWRRSVRHGALGRRGGAWDVRAVARQPGSRRSPSERW
jgi:hypothetical protein